MSPAIRTEHLDHRYRGGQGISDVSLEVPRGSIYGFLGPNGAGKTTTIRLLLGLLRPQRGRIELLGQGLDARASVLARVGSLVESPSLYPHLSGRQNLEITRRLLDLPMASIDRALSLTGMVGPADRRVSDYSLGMRQRLGIALALLAGPELLILDEPTNGLDPAGIAELRQLLQGFVHELGMTVLVSSHLLGEVEQVATHIGILQEGCLRFQGDIASLHASARARTRLRCDDAGRAWTLLQARGRVAVLAADGWVDVEAGSREVAELILLLSHAGIAVQDIALEQPTLESSFFALTAGARAVPEAA